MQTLIALGLLFSTNSTPVMPWWAAQPDACTHACYTKYQACRAKCHGASERDCQNKCADEYHACTAKCG